MKTAPPVDCAHLHSAFGPGCPYCWRPATRGVRDDWTRRSTRTPAADAPDRPGERHRLR